MTRLLIVDDSALMRRLLTDIFTLAGDFEVSVARHGEEALAMLEQVDPEVITLDIHMPGMDGLACLDQIMLRHPCPVVMVSSLTEQGAEETLEAMALGAVDVVPKPAGALSLEIEAIVPELVAKVRAAATSRIPRSLRLRDRLRVKQAGTFAAPPPRTFDIRPEASGLVLVGCSTGGPPALDALLGDLPADFPWPLLIAQHMPASFTGPLARRLDRLCHITVSEVHKPVPLVPGHAYVARGDADIILSRRGGHLVAMSAPSSPDHIWHPCVDRMVESAMRFLEPESLIGVLMTGMGTDGAVAMAALKQAGGRTIAEAEESAVIWGMPGALVGRGGASRVCPLREIGGELLLMLTR